MATLSITFPAATADFLNVYVPGFASASGGGDTVALQVPAALPAPVVAGLNDAGFQFPASGAAVAPAAPADGSGGAAVGLAQFAPAGLAPQGEALQDPNLAAANAFALNLGQAADAFLAQAAANQAPPSAEQFASFAAQQQQAIHDYVFGSGG